MYKRLYLCSVGYGRSVKEADTNAYRHALLNGHIDVQSKYTYRRRQLSPWFPTDNTLYICDVGLIEIQNGDTLHNITQNISVTPDNTYSAYTTLCKLFDYKLSFDDITCSISTELEQFLNKLTRNAISLRIFPPISFYRWDELDDKSVYKAENGIIYHIGDNYVGLSSVTDSNIITVAECKAIVDRRHIFHYLGHYLGYKQTEEGVVI